LVCLRISNTLLEKTLYTLLGECQPPAATPHPRCAGPSARRSPPSFPWKRGSRRSRPSFPRKREPGAPVGHSRGSGNQVLPSVIPAKAGTRCSPPSFPRKRESRCSRPSFPWKRESRCCRQSFPRKQGSRCCRPSFPRKRGPGAPVRHSRESGNPEKYSKACSLGVSATWACAAPLRFSILPGGGLAASTRFVTSTFQPGNLNLIAPDIESLRLAAGVPVFVDLKSHPYKDTEVVEWFKRTRIANDFYAANADACSMLDDIPSTYSITHVVMRNDSSGADCGLLHELYRDLDFAVYEVRSQ